MAWKADHVQGVIFSLPGSKQLSGLELWHAVFPDKEPDSYQGAGPSPMSATQASGKIDNFQVSLTSQIGRIDLLLSPDDSGQSSKTPPQLGSLEEALAKLQALYRLITETSKTARVATVAQLSIHFENPHDATEYLNKEADTNFPANGTDNIYQTNVRKAFRCNPTLEMNRVITLNTGVKQIFSAEFDLSSNNFGFSSAITIPVAAFKLDLNSATSEDISQSAYQMFQEQCEEIQVLVTKGIGAIHGEQR